VYPDWAESFTSKVGKAIQSLNGDCGYGFSGDYKNPSEGTCTGYYAYDDTTCDERCIVTEGIYWSIVTYLGGQYWESNQQNVAKEWTLGTPDKGMPLAFEGTNIATL